MAALAQDLRTYAVRRWPTTNHKWRKARLASILGLTERRVRSLYEGEQTAVLRQHEADAIATLIKGKEAHADTAFEERIAALEAALAALRSEMAGRPMEGAGAADAGSIRSSERRGAGSVGRRSGDGAR